MQNDVENSIALVQVIFNQLHTFCAYLRIRVR